MPVPAIAIHGSGPRAEIARSVDGNFKESDLYDRVVTLAFDWDAVAPESRPKEVRILYRFLKRHASTIGAAARAGLEFGVNSVEKPLGALQLQVHRLLQWVVAALVGMLFASLVAEPLVLVPVALVGLPTVTFAPLRWLATAVSWLQVALAAGITLLIVLAALRTLVSGSVRPFLVTFRSIALLLLQPLLVVMLGAFVAPWWLLLAIGGLIVALGYVTGGVGTAVLWAAVVAVVIALRQRWAPGSLRGLVKVGLDAFRYLGEPRYRERIQQALDKAVEQARSRVGNEQEFVLTAQGMGTVMALDSLLHSRVWRSTDQVLLVTMGSPLRRWFLTLYPGTLFPERMEALVALITRRLHALRWVNVYRPWDYMGAQLELKPFNGKDITTGIGLRRVFGHADYWRDADARLTFQHGLARLKKMQPVFVASTELVHGQPKPQGAARFHVSAITHTLLKAGVVLGTIAWTLWWAATGSGVFVPGAEGPSELLERRGFEVEAAATHRRATRERGDGVTYVDYWVFAFTDSSGVAQRVGVERDVSDAYLGLTSHGFDARALTRRIRASCGSTWPPHWLPVGTMERPCTLEGVRLRYYSGDLSVFDLPDFPQRRFGGEPPWDWIEAGVVAAVLSLLVLLVVTMGVRAFGVIVG